MCVCTLSSHVFEYICMSLCVHTEARSRCCFSRPYILRQSLSLEPRACWYPSSRQPPCSRVSCFCFPSTGLVGGLPHLPGIYRDTENLPGIYRDIENLISSLHICGTSVLPTSHMPEDTNSRLALGYIVRP